MSFRCDQNGPSARLEKQATDLRRKICYFADRTLIAIFLCAILLTGCSSLSPSKQNDLVVRVNASPTGKISKEEFVDWNIKRMFKLYDRGGKGFVTLQDWRALEGPSRDAQYKRLDASHNGKITLAEALVGFSRCVLGA